MLTILILSLLLTSVLSQPFQRLTSSLGGTTQVLNPVTPTTPYAGYSPDQLSSSTLTFPQQGLGNQMNMPNVNLQGLSPATFSDPFAPQTVPPATSNTGSLSNMLPSGLGSSINSLTTPFTTTLASGIQTSPVTNTLSNLFGPGSTTTTQTVNSIPALTSNTNNIFPIDSSQLLFPSSFSTPQTTQTSQAQLSTFSQQAPTIFQSNSAPQLPSQSSFPSQPSSPSAPQFQAPAISNFNPAAINGPSLPNSPDFNVQQAPRPALPSNSPFSAQAPGFPSIPNAPATPANPSFPIAGSQPQFQQPQFPQQSNFPNQPQAPGPVFLEAGSSVKPVASAVSRVTAPVLSSSPSLSSNPPFPSISALPSMTP